MARIWPVRQPEIEPAAGEEGKMSKKLLIVDDDPATRGMMGGFFREKGYIVSLAKNGEEAMHLIKEKPIDLIISDYQMPGMDGGELARWIYEFRPSLPVILITGRPFCERTKTSYLEGLQGYFSKPVDLMLLEISIAKALGNACLG
jgi:DNA-binding NtrC family response regulator